MVINGLLHFFTAIVNLLVLRHFFSQKDNRRLAPRCCIVLCLLILSEVLLSTFFSSELASALILLCSFLTSISMGLGYGYNKQRVLFWAIILQTAGILLENALAQIYYLLFGDLSNLSLLTTIGFITLLMLLGAIMTHCLRYLFRQESHNTLTGNNSLLISLLLSSIPTTAFFLFFLQLLDLKERAQAQPHTLLLIGSFVIILFITLVIYTYLIKQQEQVHQLTIDNLSFQAKVEHYETITENQ